AEDGIRDFHVTGVQTCALPIWRVGEVLDLVGLTAMAGRAPSQLSGGQQQRVALARCIVLEPHVLLFDEPLSNLDAKLREQMRVEIGRASCRERGWRAGVGAAGV